MITDHDKKLFQALDYDAINQHFISACQEGNIEKFEYLSFSKDLKNNVDHSYYLYQGIEWACENGHIAFIRHLFTHPVVSPTIKIHSRDESFLRVASNAGQLDIVDYLLNSPELVENSSLIIDITDPDFNPYFRACENGYLDLVQYYLERKEIKDNPQFQELLRYGLEYACLESRTNVIQYFIFERNIPKDYYMGSNSSIESEEIHKMFELRKLNHQLNSQLNKNEHSSRLKL